MVCNFVSISDCQWFVFGHSFYGEKCPGKKDRSFGVGGRAWFSDAVQCIGGFSPFYASSLGQFLESGGEGMGPGTCTPQSFLFYFMANPFGIFLAQISPVYVTMFSVRQPDFF